jgi:hypothetical protein
MDTIASPYAHPIVKEEPTGQITRVDMISTPTQGVLVRKYAAGWTASSVAADIHFNQEQSLEQMIAWFEAQGWTVRKWPGGARAFRGKPLPVRSGPEIANLRRKMRARPGDYPELAGIICTLELAYDW